MRSIGGVIRDYPAPQVTPAMSQEPTCIPLRNGGTLCLSREELGAVGYRENTLPDGRRGYQFGLCQDEAGEWVYAPVAPVNETLEQGMKRREQTRLLLKRCAKRREGWDDEPD